MRPRVLFKRIIYVGLSLMLLLGGLYLFVWGFSTLDRIYKNSPDPDDYWSVFGWQDAQTAYNLSHFAETLEGWAAFPAGGIILLLSWFSAACSLSVTKSEREKDERRRAEEVRKRLEAERVYIERLIDETRSILEDAEQNATNSNNRAWLFSVFTVERKLELLGQQFENDELSFADVRKQALFLKEQAETFRKPPESKPRDSQSTKGAETCYSILEVSPNASRKEIMDSWRKKVNEYHPDSIKRDWPKGEGAPPIPERYKRIMEEETKKLNKAKDECLERLEGKNS
jgi:DnaJ-domain-containing protein 1